LLATPPAARPLQPSRTTSSGRGATGHSGGRPPAGLGHAHPAVLQVGQGLEHSLPFAWRRPAVHTDPTARRPVTSGRRPRELADPARGTPAGESSEPPPVPGGQATLPSLTRPQAAQGRVRARPLPPAALGLPAPSRAVLRRPRRPEGAPLPAPGPADRPDRPRLGAEGFLTGWNDPGRRPGAASRPRPPPGGRYGDEANPARHQPGRARASVDCGGVTPASTTAPSPSFCRLA
jgi:hypothetical protein